MRNGLLFVLSVAVFAQNSGTITGTVSDNDGVALVKAAIEATNVATKVIYKAESSAAGAYTLKGLPTGTYDLQAVVAGMIPFEHRNLVVSAAQTTRLNVQLRDLSLNTAGEDREFFADLTRRHQTPVGPTPPHGQRQTGSFGSVAALASDGAATTRACSHNASDRQGADRQQHEGRPQFALPAERCHAIWDIHTVPHRAHACISGDDHGTRPARFPPALPGWAFASEEVGTDMDGTLGREMGGRYACSGDRGF